MELISDQQLLDELDLSTASLADTAKACKAGNIPSAISAFVSHLRNRTVPVSPDLGSQQDQRGHGFSADDLAAEADRICKHIFEFVGHPPQQLGEQIAWNEDPVDYEQWPISFNRHFHWLTLAKAYKSTGDEKYAQEFVLQLRSWIEAMPVEIGTRWIQGGWAPEGKMSLSLDAGIRMGQTWVSAFYAFRDARCFTDHDCLAMVKAFRNHADYLMDPVHFRSLSNWGAMESNGLYHIGVYFPEFKASTEWRDTAMTRLRKEIDLQMYPDGAQIELASGYHHVSLKNFVMAYEAARRNNRRVPVDYLESLERAYHYSLYVSFPDLLMPAVNDSGPLNIRDAMREASAFFPERKDFEWIASDGKSGAPLDKASSAFPYAGHFVMRSGWDRDDACLFFDGGPYGYGHQHEDKLNVILYAYGEILIADPGNYQYDTSEWRRYMLSSWSHNTVVVDGEGQHQYGKPREAYIVNEPLPHTWISQDGFNYASAMYGEGYGPGEDRTVTHRRSILYIKPDLWIITDFLSPSDEEEHSYEAAFHLTAKSASAENLACSTISNNVPGCVIHAFGPKQTSLRIAEGERDPHLRGWMPKNGDVSCCHPTPTAIYSYSGSGPICCTYIVCPVPAAGVSPIASISQIRVNPHSVTGNAGVLKRTDGQEVYFLQRVPGAHRVYVGDLETDAEAGAMVVDQFGRIQALHLANGTHVRGEGTHITVGDTIY